jgi:hypothetical protein
LSDLTSLSDEALLDRLQRGAFAYIEDFTNGDNGLVADTSRPNSPCSIAVVGLALSCYPVAVRRGWLSRAEAASRALKALHFFSNSEQSSETDATGHKGFYYHFLDMHSGRRVWHCELSLIDTALLLAGILTSGSYFDGNGSERDIRSLSELLYQRIDWTWAQHDGETVAQGWKPECGFLHYGWEGYNEAMILYILGIGSPTHPLPARSFAKWNSTYQWENLFGQDLLYSGPLFTHLFSHAWVDFRGICDKFMRQKHSDYFQNTKNAVAVQREYCARNPHSFAGYRRNLWGITAGDGPDDRDLGQATVGRHFFGYMSRGVPYGPDDGTIAPWAMLATLPFDADAAIQGTRHLLDKYPQVCSHDRFASGFNATLVRDGQPWVSQGWYGLDQGLLIIMIENYRSGLLWEITRSSTIFRRGLERAGFDGGWL